VGGLVETSLIEALTDLQFELLTTWLNDGGRMPKRSGQSPAHAYLAAPYGVYATADGHMAIAMGKLDLLAQITGLDAGVAGLDAFAARDTIKAGLAAQLAKQGSDHWMEKFVAADIWAAPVLDWKGLAQSGQFETLDLLQQVSRGDVQLRTTRLPMKIDGQRPASPLAAPALGDANDLLKTGWK
jgi:crotonobetainyl-CoA:carnitine CoA-transferase CaiB-like acyl-CoA transferase